MRLHSELLNKPPTFYSPTIKGAVAMREDTSDCRGKGRRLYIECRCLSVFCSVKGKILICAGLGRVKHMWFAFRYSLLILVLHPVLALADTSAAIKDLRDSKARQPHITVEIIAEKAISRERPARLGVLFTPDPGWHIYWRNPGDTGMAPIISWHGEAQFGELNWPFPESIPISHLVNLGYHGDTVLWSSYLVDSGLADSEGGIMNADVEWLVCKESCIPGSAKLGVDVSMISDNPLFREVANVEVFVENLDLVAYGEPLRVQAFKNVLRWEQALNEYNQSLPPVLRALVVIDQQQAYEVNVPIDLSTMN